MSRLSLVKVLLTQFELHHLPPVFGFVNGHWLDEDPSMQAVLDEWVSHGHPLGNHSYAHANLNQTPLARYLGEIEQNEKAVPRAQKFFRYPFLYEGDTFEKRATVRAFLAEHDYPREHRRR